MNGVAVVARPGLPNRWEIQHPSGRVLAVAYTERDAEVCAAALGYQPAAACRPTPPSAPELLPCPFCGEGEHLLVEHLEGTILHPAHRIRCDNCGASSGYTDRDFRANWNDRANVEALALTNARGTHE